MPRSIDSQTAHQTAHPNPDRGLLLYHCPRLHHDNKYVPCTDNRPQLICCFESTVLVYTVNCGAEQANICFHMKINSPGVGDIQETSPRGKVSGTHW